MLTATAYDTHVEQLFRRMQQLHSLLTQSGVPYRIVGGMAVYMHIFERDPLRARLTADVDAAIHRRDLQAVVEAARESGFAYRHVRGVDMLVDAQSPRARSAIHFVFLGEKVRPEYLEPVPASSPVKTREGIFLASVADLVRMKLTSYRLKDRVHVQDLDAVGLIDAAIESNLPDLFRGRLAEIRTSE